MLEFLWSESVAVSGLTISLAPRMKYIGQKEISETHQFCSLGPEGTSKSVSYSYFSDSSYCYFIYIMYRVFSYT